MNYGDGSIDGFDLPAARRNQTVTYRYNQGGEWNFSWLLEPVSSLIPDSVGNRTIPVSLSPAGTWTTTSFGTLDFEWFRNELVGSYHPGQHPVITGSLSGESFDGFWAEHASNVACDSDREDSEGHAQPHWGTLEIEFYDNFSTFCGTWSYCDQSESLDWKGWRQGGTPPGC